MLILVSENQYSQAGLSPLPIKGGDKCEQMAKKSKQDQEKDRVEQGTEDAGKL